MKNYGFYSTKVVHSGHIGPQRFTCGTAKQCVVTYMLSTLSIYLMYVQCKFTVHPFTVFCFFFPDFAFLSEIFCMLALDDFLDFFFEFFLLGEATG